MADEINVDDVAKDAGKEVLRNTTREEEAKADGMQSQLVQRGQIQATPLVEAEGQGNSSVFDDTEQALYRLTWSQPKFQVTDGYIVMRYGDGKKRRMVISEAYSYADKFSKLYDYMDEVKLIDKPKALVALETQRTKLFHENIRKADADGFRCNNRKWYEIIYKDINLVTKVLEESIKCDYNRVSSIITENALRLEEAEMNIDDIRLVLCDKIQEVRNEVHDERANRMNVNGLLERLEEIETHIEIRLMDRQAEIIEEMSKANDVLLNSKVEKLVIQSMRRELIESKETQIKLIDGWKNETKQRLLLEERFLKLENKFEEMRRTQARSSQHHEVGQQLEDGPKITRIVGRTAHDLVNRMEEFIPRKYLPDERVDRRGKAADETCHGGKYHQRFDELYKRSTRKHFSEVREEGFRKSLRDRRAHLFTESTPLQFNEQIDGGRTSSMSSDSTIVELARRANHREENHNSKTNDTEKKLMELVEKLAIQPPRMGASPGTIASLVAAVNVAGNKYHLKAKYDGTTSFKSWASVAEYKLKAGGVKEEEYFNKITDRFEGEALTIVNRLIKELKPGEDSDWSKMKERLTKLFARDVDTMGAFNRMMSVKQAPNQTAVSYFRAKSKAMEKWEEQDESKLILYMIEGALPQLREAAEMLLQNEKKPSLADMENILCRAETWMKSSAQYAKMNETNSSSYKSFSTSNSRNNSRDRSSSFRRSSFRDRSNSSHRRDGPSVSQETEYESRRDGNNKKSQQSDRSRGRDLSCFKCGDLGHFASKCPKFDETPAKQRSYKNKSVTYEPKETDPDETIIVSQNSSGSSGKAQD